MTADTIRRADSTDIELSEYTGAIETQKEHPVVKRWFHQITPCELVIPGQAVATFMMIEFRDGNRGAMVWNDGHGNWGTGGWRELSKEGLLPVDLQY